MVSVFVFKGERLEGLLDVDEVFQTLPVANTLSVFAWRLVGPGENQVTTDARVP